MKKKKNIIIVLTIFSVLLITVLSGIGYLVFNSEKIANYFNNYHMTSEKKLIQFLEKQDNVTFPQSMTNVKAGELYTGIDGSSMFILRFQVITAELNDFLLQFHKTTEDFKPYTPEADKRIGDEYPEWFKTPIEKGLIGYSPDIYIDTSNQREYVIYMEGVYKM